MKKQKLNKQSVADLMQNNFVISQNTLYCIYLLLVDLKSQVVGLELNPELLEFLNKYESDILSQYEEKFKKGEQ